MEAVFKKNVKKVCQELYKYEKKGQSWRKMDKIRHMPKTRAFFSDDIV